MSKILEKIKKERLIARKEKNTEKSTLLTTILGEVDRSGKKAENDNDVEKVIRSWIKKIRKDIEKNPFEGQEDVLASLTNVEQNYLPQVKVMSHDDLEKIVKDNGFTKKSELMPYLSKLEKETGVVIDKRYASTLVQ